MQNIFAVSLMILILCLTADSVSADTPPFPLALPQRVEAATHIFIGKAKKVTAVATADLETEKVRKVKPEPKSSGGASGVFFEVELKIQEVIYPASWKSSKNVKIHYRGGRFSIKEVREDLTQNSYIYLLRVDHENDDVVFRSSYGWNLVENLKKKEEIKSFSDKRIINTVLTIPSYWHKISICQINFFAPKNLKNQNIKGIDSCAVLFKSKEMEIEIDYGSKSGVYIKDKSLINFKEEIAEIDGKKAQVVTYKLPKGKRRFVAGLHRFVNEAQNQMKIGLNMTIKVTNEEDLKKAKLIFQSLKFDDYVPFVIEQ